LVHLKVIKVRPEPEIPSNTEVMAIRGLQELGLIRKPASFISTICDDRGQELFLRWNVNFRVKRH
jgi:ATP citrate (pro-S)-lyase